MSVRVLHSGFTTLWMALFTFPLMSAVQFICAKSGMVSGKGVAGVIRENYSRKIYCFRSSFFWWSANVVNAGVDIWSDCCAINLIIPIPIVLMIILSHLRFWHCKFGVHTS